MESILNISVIKAMPRDTLREMLRECGIPCGRNKTDTVKNTMDNQDKFLEKYEVVDGVITRKEEKMSRQTNDPKQDNDDMVVINAFKVHKTIREKLKIEAKKKHRSLQGQITHILDEHVNS